VVLTALLAPGRLRSAALDTGSSFEGMGASREVQFSALAEPALLVSFAVLARQTSALSLSEMFGQVSVIFWQQAAPSFILVLAALFIVFLAENARIPFDDLNTHLELTMAHEVMVLDHGGPDLGFILYGRPENVDPGSLIVNIVIPIHKGHTWPDISFHHGHAPAGGGVGSLNRHGSAGAAACAAASVGAVLSILA
jgi:formate hydrogenlyase subunit 4